MKIHCFFHGENEGEVKMLQVVFRNVDGSVFHTNMDASDYSEHDINVSFAALGGKNRTIFFVKPGGLERDDPSEPSTVKLTIFGTKETARRKVV